MAEGDAGDAAARSTCAMQGGQPRSRGFHSTSKRNICPEGLHPQQDLNKKKTSLIFKTQGESTESAVKGKTSLQVRGVILFSKSAKVNKHGALACCFPKNFSSGERGSDSQALKEGPGAERGFRVSRHREISSFLLTCSSSGARISPASTSHPGIAVCYWQHSCWHCVGYAARLGIPGLFA